jgi:hypothetical protein
MDRNVAAPARTGDRMRSTLNHERADYKHLNGRVHAASRTAQTVRSGDLNLNKETVDGVRVSYSIDPGDTIEAVVCAILLVPLSVACVAIVGALRVLGAR